MGGVETRWEAPGGAGKRWEALGSPGRCWEVVRGVGKRCRRRESQGRMMVTPVGLAAGAAGLVRP